MKRLAMLGLVLLAAPVLGQGVGVDSPTPVTLATMQDRYRPVLVFAPHTTSQFRHQMQLLAKAATACTSAM